MKTTAIVNATILLSAIFVGAAAQARAQDSAGSNAERYGHADKFDSRHKSANGYHHARYFDRGHDDRRYRGKPRQAAGGVVRLDIPVRIRGSERVHLRRLVRQRYDINLDNYRLKKVVVHNQRRRHASANLRVGRLGGEQQRLTRGRNHLHAARHGNGRWVLGLDNVRVDNIRVVLEPKQRWANHHRRPTQRRARGGRHTASR